MDIISAYREVGTFRGAAAISGTTPKTVRRVVARHEGGGGVPARVPREHNYDAVAGLVAERVRKTAGRDFGEAAAAGGARGGVCGVAAELPAAGRGGEAGLAGGSSPGPPSGGVVAG
jgi:hypothetical protein